METTLWIVQVLLAVIFTLTGLTKLTQPRAKMAAGPMRWAADVSDAQFRLIGALEVLGAIGLILPAALGVAPMLTPARRRGPRAHHGRRDPHTRAPRRERTAWRCRSSCSGSRSSSPSCASEPCDRPDEERVDADRNFHA